MLKIVKSLVLSILLTIAIIFGFLLTNQSNRAYAFKNQGSCFWVNSGEIQCKFQTWASSFIEVITKLKNETSLTPSEIPIAGKILFSGDNKYLDIYKWDETLSNAVSGGCLSIIGGSDCESYFYAPQESLDAGYPVFYCGDPNHCNGDHAKYLHFVSNNPLYAYLSDSSTKLSSIPKDNDVNWIPVGDIKNADGDAPGNDCSLINPANCSIRDDGKFTSKKGLDTKAFLTTIRNIQSLNALKKKCESTAPLPFITCPIFDSISSAISNLIGGQGVTGERQGLLISFLTFSPLDANKKPEALQAIVGSIVSIANAFYIIVFLLLIFSSSLPLGLDNYTIKKTLPKFIGAVIMTQFAYVICGVVIDFFNLLGNLVPNLVFALPLGSGITGGGLSGLNQGLQAVLSGPLFISGAAFALTFGWIFIIIAVIIIFVAVLVAFVYMVLRYLILFILVLLAPIAFASWVLPGTEKFFKLWWKNFIRLNAMFPMITGLIAVSIVVSQILLATGETNTAVKLVAVFIPVVALFAVPRTLKWTTDGMSAIAGGILGATAGKMNAGGRAISNQAQKQAKKGIDYGKKEAVKFGTRRLAQSGYANGMAGQDNIIGRRIRQEQGRILAEERKRSAEKYSAIGDAGEVRRLAEASMRRAAANPNDLQARADAQAAVARLAQFGGAGRNEIAGLQDVFRNAGGDVNAWKGVLGDAGIMGDLDAKAPELVGWSDDASDFGTVQERNGEEYQARSDGIDLRGRGVQALSKLGASTMVNVKNAQNKETQLGEQLNWQAASTMARTPSYHPEDAQAIEHWVDIGRQGVNYWNGVAAQAAEGSAERATAEQNARFAQDVVDGFTGSGSSGDRPTAGGGPVGSSTQSSPRNPSAGNSTGGSPGNTTINFGP